MKVLIVQPHLTVYGGAETVVVKLVNFLKKGNIENAVVCLSLSEEISRDCPGVEFILPEKKYPFKLRSTNLFDSIGVVSEIIALHKMIKKYSESYDIINVHNFPANWGLIFNQKSNVWMCNEPPDFYNNPSPSFPVKMLRTIGIACDKFIVNKFVDLLCVADNYNSDRAKLRYNKNPEIIHYGIDFEFFSKGNSDWVREKYQLDNKFVLLQVGVISPQKNQLESIKVVHSLKEHIPNIKLILAGRGDNPYEKVLRNYIHENNLGDFVIFTGHLSKKEIRDFYHCCNVAISPVKTQGGWLAPFEAICSGNPIVISPTMGAASLIKDKDLGLVSDDFSSAIKEIYHNLKFYKEKAQKAKNWVQENLTWEKFSSQMVELFKKSLERKMT